MASSNIADLFESPGYRHILAQVLSNLDEYPDILAVSATCTAANDYVSDSPELQLHLRGTAASLPYYPGFFGPAPTALARMIDVQRNWARLTPKAVVTLPALDRLVEAFSETFVDGTHVALQLDEDTPSTTQIKAFGWTLRDLEPLRDGVAFEDLDVLDIRCPTPPFPYYRCWEACPVENLMVVPSWEFDPPLATNPTRTRVTLNIHLLTLEPPDAKPGTPAEALPHPEATVPVLSIVPDDDWESAAEMERVGLGVDEYDYFKCGVKLGPDGALLVFASGSDFGFPYTLWNWRNGTEVLRGEAGRWLTESQIDEFLVLGPELLVQQMTTADDFYYRHAFSHGDSNPDNAGNDVPAAVSPTGEVEVSPPNAVNDGATAEGAVEDGEHGLGDSGAQNNAVINDAKGLSAGNGTSDCSENGDPSAEDNESHSENEEDYESDSAEEEYQHESLKYLVCDILSPDTVWQQSGSPVPPDTIGSLFVASFSKSDTPGLYPTQPTAGPLIAFKLDDYYDTGSHMAVVSAPTLLTSFANGYGVQSWEGCQGGMDWVSFPEDCRTGVGMCGFNAVCIASTNQGNHKIHVANYSSDQGRHFHPYGSRHPPPSSEDPTPAAASIIGPAHDWSRREDTISDEPGGPDRPAAAHSPFFGLSDKLRLSRRGVAAPIAVKSTEHAWIKVHADVEHIYITTDEQRYIICF